MWWGAGTNEQRHLNPAAPLSYRKPVCTFLCSPLDSPLLFPFLYFGFQVSTNKSEGIGAFGERLENVCCSQKKICSQVSVCKGITGEDQNNLAELSSSIQKLCRIFAYEKLLAERVSTSPGGDWSSSWRRNPQIAVKRRELHMTENQS